VKEKSPGTRRARTPAWPEAMIARNAEETRNARRSRRRQSRRYDATDAQRAVAMPASSPVSSPEEAVEAVQQGTRPLPFEHGDLLP